MCGGVLPLISRSVVGIVSRSAGRPWRSVWRLGDWHPVRAHGFLMPAFSALLHRAGARLSLASRGVGQRKRTAEWHKGGGAEGRKAVSDTSPGVYLSQTATGSCNHRWGLAGCMSDGPTARESNGMKSRG